MSIEALGMFGGDLPVYLSDGPARTEDLESLPPGHFACGLAFQDPDFDALALGRHLNVLYGLPDVRERFRPDRGARAFAFFGVAAERAHDICDTYAFGWLGGGASEADAILTTWEAVSSEEFAITLFSAALADRYGHRTSFLVESYGDDGWLRNVRSGLATVIFP